MFYPTSKLFLWKRVLPLEFMASSTPSLGPYFSYAFKHTQFLFWFTQYCPCLFCTEDQTSVSLLLSLTSQRLEYQTHQFTGISMVCKWNVLHSAACVVSYNARATPNYIFHTEYKHWAMLLTLQCINNKHRLIFKTFYFHIFIVLKY